MERLSQDYSPEEQRALDLYQQWKVADMAFMDMMEGVAERVTRQYEEGALEVQDTYYAPGKDGKKGSYVQVLKEKPEETAAAGQVDVLEEKLFEPETSAALQSALPKLSYALRAQMKEAFGERREVLEADADHAEETLDFLRNSDS